MDKYRKSRIRYVAFVAALLAILFTIDYVVREINSSPERQPITDSLIMATYPELYEAVFNRSAAELQPYLSHESGEIRRQAWRALAGTPVDSLDWMIAEVAESNTEEAWLALGLHSPAEDQLRQLERMWMQEPELRRGISQVLGRQGDEETLQFLLDQQEEAAGSPYEYAYALAIGRLMTRFELSSGEQRIVVRRAFETASPATTRSYLYGFYRGSVQKLNTEERDSLYQQWKLYGLGNNTNVDQYVAKILKQQVFYEIIMYYNSEELLDRKVQLGIELAQILGELELTSDNALAAKVLVIHPNPIVVQQTLAGLEGKLSKEDHLFSYIRQDILEGEQTSPFVWLQALETASSVDPGLINKHSDRLEQIQANHPYLLPRVLSIWRSVKSPADFLDLIASMVKKNDPLQTQFAVQALADYWTGLSEESISAGIVEKVREIVFEALSQHDRGVAYMARDLLMQENLFSPQDFNRINQALEVFQLPEDIEVYQAFGLLYKERFEKQARPVVDSLASLEYAPLNRSLDQVGWDVEVPDKISQSFRTPDWGQLWKLGRRPVWVLDTEKGIIKVQVDVLSVPTTASAIDSLTRAGAYDGVPFHRVVPNFVIQGGDIERQDGFGGPDFVIPTEPSEKEYVRGAAGIASAGPDTEGSQYFFMHQWSPHLNGRYTQFGQIIEGIDVVDRIVAGDMVKRAYWE